MSEQKIEIYGRVVNGRIEGFNRKRFESDLRGFDGKTVMLTVQRKNTRSAQQNKYIHALFTMFTDCLNDLGNEFRMLEVKEMCKKKFATVDMVNESTGEVIGERVRGTHEMSKTELNEFFEAVIRYASEMFHIQLPYPGEEMKIDFDE